MAVSFQVLALGSNGSGQLGVGNTSDTAEPTVCKFPVGKLSSRPVRIAAGGNHSLVLFEDGSLYAAGCNEDGRCGVEVSPEVYTTFVQVRFSITAESLVTRFKFVAATWESSTFVTFDNRVFTSGSGKSGELGQGEGITDSPMPREFPDFPPKYTEIIDIAACMRHTAVVLSNGEVYGWGAGRKGQLGEPKEKVVWSPRKIGQWETGHAKLPNNSASRVVCCRDVTYIISSTVNEGPALNPHSTLDVNHGEDIALGALRPGEDWKAIATTWRGLHILVDGDQIVTFGKPKLSKETPEDIKTLMAGSEHVLCETTEGRILASGWGEHGNCGKPIGVNGVIDGWNELCSGNLLGGGCATSWIFRELPAETEPHQSVINKTNLDLDAPKITSGSSIDAELN